MAINDGGYAFPYPALANVGFNPQYDMGGMKLRDYLAANADQPGVMEAYQLEGSPDVPKPAGWREDNWNDPAHVGSRADAWWRALPLDEKYRIYATLRYKIADAMLAARDAKGASDE